MELDLLEPFAADRVSGIILSVIVHVMERLGSSPDMEGDACHAIRRVETIDGTAIQGYGCGARKRRFCGVEGVKIVLGACHLYTPSKVFAYIGADDNAPKAKGLPVVG